MGEWGKLGQKRPVGLERCAPNLQGGSPEHLAGYGPVELGFGLASGPPVLVGAMEPLLAAPIRPVVARTTSCPNIAPRGHRQGLTTPKC